MAGPQLGLRSLERSAGVARLADATAAPQPHSVLARGPRLHTHPQCASWLASWASHKRVQEWPWAPAPQLAVFKPGLGPGGEPGINALVALKP